LHIIDTEKNLTEKISSTKIRNLISIGNIEKANRILGRHFSFKGRVVKGNGLGIKLGFPTLNINPLKSRQLVPGNGVYCVEVLIDNQLFLGMCNIGFRPTFYEKSKKNIEVHIINYIERDIYDEIIEVRFKKFLREEKKYDNRNDLIFQLNYDKKECLKLSNIN
jgi:riboflavin kinase/FMN adenylyltransferase